MARQIPLAGLAVEASTDWSALVARTAHALLLDGIPDLLAMAWFWVRSWWFDDFDRWFWMRFGCNRSDWPGCRLVVWFWCWCNWRFWFFSFGLLFLAVFVANVVVVLALLVVHLLLPEVFLALGLVALADRLVLLVLGHLSLSDVVITLLQLPFALVADLLLFGVNLAHVRALEVLLGVLLVQLLVELLGGFLALPQLALLRAQLAAEDGCCGEFLEG
jgi:hypothetical protein